MEFPDWVQVEVKTLYVWDGIFCFSSQVSLREGLLSIKAFAFFNKLFRLLLQLLLKQGVRSIQGQV